MHKIKNIYLVHQIQNSQTKLPLKISRSEILTETKFIHKYTKSTFK